MTRCAKPLGNCRRAAVGTSPYCAEHTVDASASRVRVWGVREDAPAPVPALESLFDGVECAHEPPICDAPKQPVGAVLKQTKKSLKAERQMERLKRFGLL